MKTLLITGMRDWSDAAKVHLQLSAFYYHCDEHDYKPHVVVGCARGADELVRDWHAERRLMPSLTVYKANWEVEGRSAGMKRNTRMVQDGAPDWAIAFWDGKSRGTGHCISQCRAAGVPVRIVY